MFTFEIGQALETGLAHYGAWVIFFIIYLESFGLPLPGETGLIAGSLLAAAGKMNLPSLLIAAYVAAVLGDCTGYAIGYFGGKKLLLRFGHIVRLTPERLEKFEKMLDRRGFYFVVIARFIAVARQLNGVIAGSGSMPWYKFLLANVLGACIWVFAWGAGPYIVKTLLS